MSTTLEPVALGLVWIVTCGVIICHLKQVPCLPLEFLLPFFCLPTEGMILISINTWWRYTFQCYWALTSFWVLKPWKVSGRHSDVPFFQGIVQVTSSFSKCRNSSFFSSFSAAGTVTFSFLFQFLYPHNRHKTSPSTNRQLLYILTLILLFFTAVLNYLILSYYNMT